MQSARADFFGVGLGQVYRNIHTFPNRTMILFFAIICEELGFVGAVFCNCAFYNADNKRNKDCLKCTRHIRNVDGGRDYGADCDTDGI